MTNAKWLFGYAVFLFLCGIAGFLSNPEKAQTALISGSVCAAISALWGYLMIKGMSFARIAALATTAMLCGVFTWRSIKSWMMVMEGLPKTFAASLITLMLVGSLLTMTRLAIKKA